MSFRSHSVRFKLDPIETTETLHDKASISYLNKVLELVFSKDNHKHLLSSFCCIKRRPAGLVQWLRSLHLLKKQRLIADVTENLTICSQHIQKIEREIGIQQKKSTITTLINRLKIKLVLSLQTLSNFNHAHQLEDLSQQTKLLTLLNVFEKEERANIGSAFRMIQHKAKLQEIKKLMTGNDQSQKTKLIISLMNRLAAKRESAVKMLSDISIRKENKNLKHHLLSRSLPILCKLIKNKQRKTIFESFDSIIGHRNKEELEVEKKIIQSKRLKVILMHAKRGLQRVQAKAFLKLLKAGGAKYSRQSATISQIKTSLIMKQAVCIAKLTIAASHEKIRKLEEDIKRSLVCTLVRRLDHKVRISLLELEFQSSQNATDGSFLTDTAVKLIPPIGETPARVLSGEPIRLDHIPSFGDISAPIEGPSAAKDRRASREEILEKIGMVKQRSAETLRRLSDSSRAREIKRVAKELETKAMKQAFKDLRRSLTSKCLLSFEALKRHSKEKEVEFERIHNTILRVNQRLAASLVSKTNTAFQSMKHIDHNKNHRETQTAPPSMTANMNLFHIDIQRPPSTISLHTTNPVSIFPRMTSTLHANTLGSLYQIIPKKTKLIFEVFEMVSFIPESEATSRSSSVRKSRSHSSSSEKDRHLAQEKQRANEGEFTVKTQQIGCRLVVSVLSRVKNSSLMAAFSSMHSYSLSKNLEEQQAINAVHCQRILELHKQLENRTNDQPLEKEPIYEIEDQPVQMSNDEEFIEDDPLGDCFGFLEWYSCPARAENDQYMEIDPIEVLKETQAPLPQAAQLIAIGENSVEVEYPMANRVRFFARLSKAVRVSERLLLKSTLHSLLS